METSCFRDSLSLLAYTAFMFMLEDTAFAQASSARRAVEFLAVANVMPAFAAFYGAIDILKHRRKEIGARELSRFDRCA
jgi:hypothetical protein